MEYTMIIVGAFSGMLYAGSAYLKKAQGESPEKFDPFKAGATALLGAAVGAGFALSGIPITEDTLLAQVAAVGFTTVILENGLKVLYRAVMGKKNEA